MEHEVYEMKRSKGNENEDFLRNELSKKKQEIAELKDTRPDGWVITAPGKENLAFHHKGTAIEEAEKLGYMTIRSFKYLD